MFGDMYVQVDRLAKNMHTANESLLNIFSSIFIKKRSCSENEHIFKMRMLLLLMSRIPWWNENINHMLLNFAKPFVTHHKSDFSNPTSKRTLRKRFGYTFFEYDSLNNMIILLHIQQTISMKSWAKRNSTKFHLKMPHVFFLFLSFSPFWVFDNNSIRHREHLA